MDPIGFGLEQYDATGVFRTHDTGHPECPLDGKGTYLVGTMQETFDGPAGLQTMILADPSFDGCFLGSLFEYVQGRSADQVDGATLDKLTADYRATDRHLKDLLMTIIASDSFAIRQEATP